jgi:hypothetical protein
VSSVRGFNFMRVGDYKSMEKYFKSIRVKGVRDYGLRVSIISFKGYDCKDYGLEELVMV